jgi:cell division protease FtsH
MPETAQQPPSPPQQQQIPSWVQVLWIVALVLLGIHLFGLFTAQSSKQIPYSQFKSYLQKGRVAEVTIQGQKINGRFASPVSFGSDDQTREFERFKTTRPPWEDPEMIDALAAKNVEVNAKSTDQTWWGRALILLLPWLLIIGLFWYSGKKMRERLGGMGGGAGPFGFGKSKAKIYSKSSRPGADFTQVAGMEGPKKELTEVIDYLREPDKFKTLGGHLPRGMLLVGPPGTGKTLMAKAVAGEADVPFYSISGSEFIEMFVGVGASRVRDMFNDAKQSAPAIIFIDELDSIGRVRGAGMGGGHDEREQTLNQILSEMDGFTERESVVVLAATNRPDVLDPALLRPGRFDRKVHLEMPQKKARKKILEVHTKEVPLADDVDLDQVAAGTVGFSGADLENLVNEASLMAGRRDSDRVAKQDFDQALDKVLMGLEREDILNPEDRRLIAYHEAGHTLTALFSPKADPIKKVTIIPRGQALGATEQLPEEDRYNMSRGYLFDRVAVTLGGRAAEELIFDEITTGAKDDLKQATKLVMQMVSSWGMSDKIGLAAFPRSEPHPFLGREMAEHRDYSEHTARIIDDEVRRLLDERYQHTKNMLTERRGQLEKLAEALLEHETMELADIKELLGLGGDGDGQPERRAGEPEAESEEEAARDQERESEKRQSEPAPRGSAGKEAKAD